MFKPRNFTPSLRTKILLAITGLVLLVDVILIIDLTLASDFDGYAILAVVAAQIIFIPAFLIGLLLSFFSYSRDKNSQIKEEVENAGAVSFIEKFKIASSKQKMMFSIGLILLLVSTSAFFGSNQIQDNEESIIDLTPNDESITPIYLTADTGISVYAMRYEIDDSLTFVRYDLDRQAESVMIGAEIASYSSFTYIRDMAVTDTYIYLIVEYNQEPRRVELQRYDGNTITEVASFDDPQYVRSFGDGVHTFYSENFDETPSTVNTYFDSGEVYSHQFDEVIYDIHTTDDSTYVIYGNEDNQPNLTVYNDFSTSGYNGTTETLELNPPFQLDPSQFGTMNSITLFSIENEVFYRSLSNFYSISRNLSSRNPQEFSQPLNSIEHLEGTAWNENYIYLNTLNHISIYDRQSLDELNLLHSPGSDYSGITYLPMVLQDDNLYSLDLSNKLYIWPVTLDAIETANTISIVLLGFGIGTLIIGALLLVREYSKISELGYQK